MDYSVDLNNYTLGIINPADFSKGDLYGGAQGFVRSILPYLTFQEVIIFGLGINGTTPWKDVYLGSNTRFVPISDFTFPSRIPMRLKALYAYTRYQKRILNNGIDILYVHSPEICLPFLYLNKNIPVIYHQHGFSNALHSSKYSYGEAKIFRKFFDLALWLIHKKANWIIAIDPIGLQQAAANGAENKTTLIMNAVDMNHFRPDRQMRIDARKRFGLKDDEFAIINAGRIEKQKGIQRIFKCIPILKAEGINFHIFCAGDGTYKTHLLDFLKTNHYEEYVTFLGRVSHEDLPFYYNMADIFVLPSEKEGVPMAILEAIACGTPTVANNVGGIPGFLQDGVNGMLLYGDLSPTNITSAILQVFHRNYDRSEVSNTIKSLGSGNIVSILQGILANILKREEEANGRFP